jgi:hypothetical protein
LSGPAKLHPDAMNFYRIAFAEQFKLNCFTLASICQSRSTSAAFSAFRESALGCTSYR